MSYNSLMASQRKRPPPSPASPTGRLRLARSSLVLAMGISGYLAWNSLAGGGIAGCGPGSGCDEVLQSRWAYWLGLPVSLPALLVYLALLGSTGWIGPDRPRMTQRRAWWTLIGLSSLVVGAAGWFVGLQLFVIQKVCYFCLGAHAAALLGAGLLLSLAPIPRSHAAPKGSGPSFTLPRRTLVRCSLIGVAGIAILGAGQGLVSKQQFEVQSAKDAAVVSGPAEDQARQLSLHGGEFRLNLNELPLLGSPDAPHVVVSLFDYTCHFCRDMHHLLQQARQRYADQLAIVSLPMPLDASCNHLISRTPRAHEQACEYARLGLAVWRSHPESFERFDHWVFQPESPLPLDQVRQYAEELVGAQALETALQGDWIDRQIQTDIAIFQANNRQTQSGRMPQLIIGDTISTGPLNRVEELYLMLEEQFGLAFSK